MVNRLGEQSVSNRRGGGSGTTLQQSNCTKYFTDLGKGVAKQEIERYTIAT